MAEPGGGGQRLLVPKGPRAGSPGLQGLHSDAVIEELRRQLFLMPLPPNPTGTRTYPTHTALGRIMRLRRVSVNEVAKIAGGPSAKQLGEALSERRALSNEHKDALAVGLGVDRRLLN